MRLRGPLGLLPRAALRTQHTPLRHTTHAADAGPRRQSTRLFCNVQSRLRASTTARVAAVSRCRRAETAREILLERTHAIEMRDRLGIGIWILISDQTSHLLIQLYLSIAALM